MDLIIHIVGNKDKLVEANKLDISQLDIVKIAEKDLSKRKFIKNLIKKQRYRNVYFGCIDLNFQKFLTFMLFFILAYNATRGALIDENGNKIRAGFVKFLFYYLPKLILEVFKSSLVTIYYYIKFFKMRREKE